ncbi:MAG: hypothetical protein NTZ73_01600 [Candidatus Diapherotrites archaeon]|nr:hypothetical protein [Candidatus Diapherotrites archaeon]
MLEENYLPEKSCLTEEEKHLTDPGRDIIRQYKTKKKKLSALIICAQFLLSCFWTEKKRLFYKALMSGKYPEYYDREEKAEVPLENLVYECRFTLAEVWDYFTQNHDLTEVIEHETKLSNSYKQEYLEEVKKGNYMIHDKKFVEKLILTNKEITPIDITHHSAMEGTNSAIYCYEPKTGARFWHETRGLDNAGLELYFDKVMQPRLKKMYSVLLSNLKKS